MIRSFRCMIPYGPSYKRCTMEYFNRDMFVLTLICFVVDISKCNFNLVKFIGSKNKEYSNKIRSNYRNNNFASSISLPIAIQQEREEEDLSNILYYEEHMSNIQHYYFPFTIKTRYKRNLNSINKVYMQYTKTKDVLNIPI